MSNISKEILKIANKYNLESINTGGNREYIYKEIDNNRYIILTSNNNEDVSPDRIEESCNINIFINKNWTIGIKINFNNVIEAIDFMSKYNFNIFDYENILN